MVQMADLEELVLGCKNPTSKIYVTEAIGAYHAGSIRASIVTTWIAVYFDLVSKIRSLSAANSQDAIKWIQRFDEDFGKYRPEDPGTIRPLQQREETILNDAQNKFGLITPMELMDLKQLRDDRHRCAHPSMRSLSELYSPSPETARKHLRNAIDFVLSRPAIQGQMAVDRTLELIRDEGFPNTRASAADVLRSSLLSTMKTQELADVVDGVLTTMFDKETQSPGRLQQMSALEGIRDIHPNWFSDTFGSILTEHLTSNTPLPVYLIASYSRSRAWLMPLVETISLGRIRHLLLSIPLSVEYAKESIVSSLWIDDIAEWARKRLQEFRPEIIEEYEPHIPRDIWLDQAIVRIEKSDRVETTYAVLGKQLGSWSSIGELTDNQINRILVASARKDAVRESIATPKFFANFLEYPFRDSYGSKHNWERAIAALRTDDETKSNLLEKVARIPEPELDMNDVPF